MSRELEIVYRDLTLRGKELDLACRLSQHVPCINYFPIAVITHHDQKKKKKKKNYERMYLRGLTIQEC